MEDTETKAALSKITGTAERSVFSPCEVNGLKYANSDDNELDETPEPFIAATPPGSPRASLLLAPPLESEEPKAGPSGTSPIEPVSPCDLDERAPEPIELAFHSQLETPKAETLNTEIKKRYSNLFSRPKVYTAEAEVSEAFQPDIKLTPFEHSPGIYHVLSSGVGLDNHRVSWMYSFIRNGKLSHTWSLLPMYNGLNEEGGPVRPIGLLDTMAQDIEFGTIKITDLQFTWEANVIQSAHCYDSYSLDGTHMIFKIEEGFTYEWVQDAQNDASGTKPLFLFKKNDNTNEKHLAAKLVKEQYMENPCNKSSLWSIEIDCSRVIPHVAFISAFSIKCCHSKFASWFIKKGVEIHPSTPLLNFAFQDDGKVLGRSNKFWGDWEEERLDISGSNDTGIANHQQVKIIKSFSAKALMETALTEKVVKLLNDEIDMKVREIKSYYSIE